MTVPNTVVLMFVRGWQGGTLHQIATELGVTTQDIQSANMERMGELMRLAQSKLRYEMIQRYRKADVVSLKLEANLESFREELEKLKASAHDGVDEQK